MSWLSKGIKKVDKAVTQPLVNGAKSLLGLKNDTAAAAGATPALAAQPKAPQLGTAAAVAKPPAPPKVNKSGMGVTGAAPSFSAPVRPAAGAGMGTGSPFNKSNLTNLGGGL